MQAADHIERNPTEFDFFSVEMPKCGTPACALGWVAHFLGITDELETLFERFRFLDKDCHFYEGMDELMGEAPRGKHDKKEHWGPWKDDATLCARGMRLYAEKYCHD